MAGYSGGKLAASIHKAGGLGFLGVGHLSSEDSNEFLEREIDIFQKETLVSEKKVPPLCLGFISHSSLRDRDGPDRLLQVLEKYRPFAVQFSFPAVYKDNIRLVKEQYNPDCLVVTQVTNESEIKQVLDLPEEEKKGVDCIVAQGTNAGGHGIHPDLGSSTMGLVSRAIQMVREKYNNHDQQKKKRPSILAAGGIADGKSLASYLALGCDGVVVGTRLCATTESLADIYFKQALVNASLGDVTRSRVFDLIQNCYTKNPWPIPYDSSGALKNELLRQWGDINALQKYLSNQQCQTRLAREYREACESNDYELGCVYAGEGVNHIHSIESATKVILDMEKEAIESIQGMQDFLIKSS